MFVGSIKGPVVNFEDFQALRSELLRGGAREIQLVSNSMAPLLPTGARAMVEGCSIGELKPFEIVVFWENGKLICHVVCGQGELPAADGQASLVTRGLSSKSFDLPIPADCILGRVTSHRLTWWQKTKFIWSTRRN